MTAQSSLDRLSPSLTSWQTVYRTAALMVGLHTITPPKNLSYNCFTVKSNIKVNSLTVAETYLHFLFSSARHQWCRGFDYHI